MDACMKIKFYPPIVSAAQLLTVFLIPAALLALAAI